MSNAERKSQESVAAVASEPVAAARPLDFEPASDRRNHNVFRYPAKFHPPIANKLIEMFSKAGETVLDPFCGSGTLLVEAAVLGRNSIGTDVDPLAVFIAGAKARYYEMDVIGRHMATLIGRLNDLRALDAEKWGSFEDDIDEISQRVALEELIAYVPHLPKIEHWFRRRVVVQLAQIRREILSPEFEMADTFFKLCFGSIIRNASNADPVPVSGLEVTSHMLRKEEAGRSIDPFKLMVRALTRIFEATKGFEEAREASARVVVREADARHLNLDDLSVPDAAITSPPYLTAVDYYRRHTLEMYWLGLTDTTAERLDIMPRYIGRDRVGNKHLPTADEMAASEVVDRWLKRFPDIKPHRKNAFIHYCDGMSRALARMAEVVKPGGPIVIVAGDVRFCGQPVSMLELMTDLSRDILTMTDHLWYPIVNRYMSYTRHNEANIAADHVLVFRQKEG